MSGIAGIFSLGETMPAKSQIEAMVARLECRGPDGTNVLLDGRIALGHTLLATTPEALVETLPFTDVTTGCMISADARLDNREHLLAALGMEFETRTIGDGELILRSYLKWGDECPTQLLGDFAFAIADPRSSSLLCARDQVGMRQLNYHYDEGRHFVFATEPGAILALPEINAELNHDRMGDYLGNMERADLTSTFFRTIHRLPPAHILKVDCSGVVLRRYWELAPEPTLQLPSDDAYAEAFLAIFTEAVRCRMRNVGSIGAMVSGGIDSNAVAAVAAKLLISASGGPLPTFSAIDPDEYECPETRAIMTAIRSPEFAPTTISHAALGSLLGDLKRQTAQSAEPFDGSMALLRAVYLAAQRAGIKIVLDGGGGDVLLSSNFHVAFLLRKGRVRQAIREARGKRRFSGPRVSVWRSVLAAGWQAFVPTPLRAIRFRHGRRKADRHFLYSATTLAPFIDPIRALNRRRQVQQEDFERDRVDEFTRMRSLTHPNQVVGRERYDRVASACGIEPRDPFLDLRLIRFCLSLPRDQVQRDGWPKWILRQAMDHAVPTDIAWRRGKEHLGPKFTQAAIAESASVPHDLSKPAHRILFHKRCEKLFLLNWFAYMNVGGCKSRATTRGIFDENGR